MSRRLMILALGVALAGCVPLNAACGGSVAPTVSATPHDVSPSASPTPSAFASAAGGIDIRDLGATGGGSVDDSAAVQRAVEKAARSGAAVYVPPGTYLCSTPVRVGDGVVIRGEGDSSWLKGMVEFGSRDRFVHLRIGDAGDAAVTNADGAAHSSFIGCRLHGGGSQLGTESSVVYLGGPQGSVSHVLFQDCGIERTSYVPPPGVDAYANGVGNTITIHEWTYLPDAAHVADITFRHCHLGASNGRATGALRMMMEAFCWDNRTGRSYHGWQDLSFVGCTVEASDNAGLDFADTQLSSDPSRHSASGVLVQGCTFLGAHKDLNSQYTGLPIVYECPSGVVIRDNTFYATPHGAIGGSHVGEGATHSPGLLIQGNTFDMTKSPMGLTHDTGEPCVSLVGYDSQILGNTFIYETGIGLLIKSDVSAAGGNVARGNTFEDRRTSDGESAIQLADKQGKGCRDNQIVGNTIAARGAGGAGVIAQTGGGPNYAFDNTIFAGDSTPFVVTEGRLIESGNSVR